MKMTKRRKAKLKNFIDCCDEGILTQLESIKCKCFFTMLLYSYLSENAVVDEPIVVNIHHIYYMTNVSRNTIQKAFRELLKLGFIALADDDRLKFSNQPHKVIVNKNSDLVNSINLTSGVN
jgi:predicted transcriptional regulator